MNFVRAGAAFLIRDRRMGQHIFFVLTDPDAIDQLVVVVALVTERAHTDKTIELRIGDHPFVRHASNIDYGSARFVPRIKLEEWLRSGRATVQPDMSPSLLARVREGMLRSSRTIHALAEYCRTHYSAKL